MKELENNLGVLLLKRQGRSFEITPSWTVLLSA
nr:hypothetical protein [Pediococcus pentosaceus]